MKKLIILAFSFASVLGCPIVTEQSTDTNNDLDIISAIAPPELKTSVDGINLTWSAGDAITVFDANDTEHAFTLKTGAGEGTATFEGSLGGETIGEYALYPDDAANAKFSTMATVSYKSSFVYGTSPTPMLGTNTSGTNYTFQHIGGAIRIQYKNVPASAATFEFEETSVSPQKICGEYEFDDITDGVAGAIGTGSSKVTVTSLPGTSNIEIVVPLPAGSYKFTVRLKNSGGTVIHASEKSVGSAKTISVGHILNIGAIVLPTEVTVTKSISDLCTDSDDAKVVTPLDLNGDDIITVSQTGDGNNGKYYKSDHSLRYYSSSSGNMTITLASGYTLRKVNATFSGTFTGLTSGSDAEATGSSVSYACTANANVTSISVTYIATANTVEPSKVPTPVITDIENVVTISCLLAGASIYYTLDGSTPSSSSTPYDGPFEIDEDVSVKAIAYKAGYGDSSVSAAHDVDYDSSLACASPTISCSSNVVTISCATEGTTIRYTTDGSTSPSRTVGTIYDGTFVIAANTTVKAVAYKLGYANSSVTTQNCVYENILATPTAEITDINKAASTMSIKWGAVANATDYNWTISTASSWASVTVGNTIASGTKTGATYDSVNAIYTYTKTGLSSLATATPYYLYVQAVDGTDSYDPSVRGIDHAILYQHVFTAKPSTGSNVALSSINWNIIATELGSYNSTNYAGVQLGASKKDGAITLTSSNSWGGQSGSYKDYGTVKKVVLWLNLGGTSVTPSVTIGGKSATSDGTTVVKNSSAGSDYTQTTRVTFTPAADGKTGVVVASVSTVKAGYICALEVLSK